MAKSRIAHEVDEILSSKSTVWAVTDERVLMLRWAQKMFESQPGDTAKRNKAIAAEMVAEASRR